MPPKKKTATGYKFASPLPKGIILEDIAKKKWKLGVSVGKGGFGEIYSAQEGTASGDKYPYVVKIEPHENGPLFVEINFYIRNAKAADVERFMQDNGLKTFGMPIYYGSGSHEYNGEKYRFLIMEKFGNDLLKLFTQNNKQFPVDTVFKVGLQIIDVLKYMHEKGYVHADIKAANLLMGLTKQTQNKQVYLVDFGLATKYSLDKEFKPNPKKAHDGTIEYLSRDAHLGVQTRRGDMEILAYNMIHWLGCKLPWENKIKDPKLVQGSKEESMSSVSNMIKVCFGSKSPPKAMVDYLTYLNTLKFNTEPDYKKIKSIFMSGVKEAGGTVQSPLQFTVTKTPLKRVRTPASADRSDTNKNNGDYKINGEETTPKMVKGGRPRKGLAKVLEDSDKDLEDQSEDEVISRPKKGYKTDFLSKAHEDDSLSETGSDNEAEPPYKRRVIAKNPSKTQGKLKSKAQPKKTKKEIKTVANNANEDETNPVEKQKARSRRIPTAKPINYDLSDISEQDSDNEESHSKKTVRPRKSKGKARSRPLAKDNDEASDAEMAHSDVEQATKKKQKRKPAAGNLKKGQAVSLNDLTQGYTDAMKEVLLKKLKKEKKKIISNS